MERNIVYFLGAGLTKSLEVKPKRVPLMNDFIAVLADRLEDETILTHLAHLEIADLFQTSCPEARNLAIEILVKDNNSRAIRDQLREALKNRPPENIEALVEHAARVGSYRGTNPLTYLDRSELDDPETGAMVVKYFALGEAPLRFNFAINSYFDWVGWDLKLDLLQRFVSRQLALPDTTHTFISFNYDLALDRCLQIGSSGQWDFGDGYGFPIRHFLTTDQAEKRPSRIQTINASRQVDRKIQLLKPHGSLNWFLPFDGSYQFHSEPVVVILDPEMRISYCSSYNIDKVGFPNGSTKNIGLFLYPPLERKRGYEFIRRIWDEETEAVRAANEIYIIGWSLPMTDAGQTTLITEALKGRRQLLEQITVVNYGAPSGYFDRIASLVQVDQARIIRHNHGFEDYVASM